MRKLVVTEFISLDGVIEEPAWTFPYWSDQIANFKQAELFGSDGMLLGRVTYQGFAEAWPGRTDEAGYADRFNGMPKAVVTTTLHDLAWNNSMPIHTDIAAEINKLKAQEGQDILVFGSGTLIQTLIELDLVDRYNLLVYPVVLGKGQKLFKDGSAAKLKLVDATAFDTGVTALVYETDRG